MTRDELNGFCAGLPGAERSDPWGEGHDAWKVGGRMFACIGATNAGISVKTEGIEMAEMLILVGIGHKAPYFHRSWILLPLNTPVEEAHHRIRRSYELIRSKLPKRVQSTLGPT